jgi:hypothetical protein
LQNFSIASYASILASIQGAEQAARYDSWVGTAPAPPHWWLQHCPCRTRDVQQQGSNSIDDARALANWPLTDTIQSLEVELLGSLRRHELIVGRCTASAIASA